MPMASRHTSPGSASSQGSIRSYLREMSERNGGPNRDGKGPSAIEDLFGAGSTGHLMYGCYDTDPVHAWFQNRHLASGRKLVDSDGICRIDDEDGTTHEWKPPLGVRLALANKLSRPHIVNSRPWYVSLTIKGKRGKKYFQSLASAVEFVTTRAQYVDPRACIVSRHGYDIPRQLRGRIPKPWKWCPCCMDARKFIRSGNGDQTFFHIVKQWSEEKGRYVWKEHKLWLTECPVCGITNRNHIFRRSNQPWHVRKLKPGTRLRKKGKR